jgi:hypothetical protein
VRVATPLTIRIILQLRLNPIAHLQSKYCLLTIRVHLTLFYFAALTSHIFTGASPRYMILAFSNQWLTLPSMPRTSKRI